MASGGIAPFIRNLDEGEWSASRFDRFPPAEEPPIPTKEEVVCAPEPVLTLRRMYEFLTPAWRRLFVCLFNGRPRQATDVLQPAGLLYHPLWTFQLWPPDSPAPTVAFRTLERKLELMGGGRRTDNFA
jgi:hypothetical protein